LRTPENNKDFALARKPSSAVKKAAPRAKRIVSGMVGDALALAKKKSSLRIVVIDDDSEVLELLSILIEETFENATVLAFTNPNKAVQELLHTDPDLLITDDKMPSLTGQDIVRRLFDKNVTYPIIVHSGWTPTEEWVREYVGQGFNVKFVEVPFKNHHFIKILETALKPPRKALD
jgi:FixJ family two-component response regulator